MTDFFDMEVSAKNNLYTQLEPGDTKLRVLSDIIGGWEGWYKADGWDKGKPVRFAQDYKITSDEHALLEVNRYEPTKKKWGQFGACIVWNYNENAVQIWQFSSKAIIGAIQSLRKDDDWGDLKNYDIKVNKTGTGSDTRYEVKPVAPKPVAKEVTEAYKASGLAPTQIFNDQKNIDNIKALREALGTKTEDTIAEGDIPF